MLFEKQNDVAIIWSEFQNNTITSKFYITQFFFMKRCWLKLRYRHMHDHIPNKIYLWSTKYVWEGKFGFRANHATQISSSNFQIYLCLLCTKCLRQWKFNYMFNGRKFLKFGSVGRNFFFLGRLLLMAMFPVLYWFISNYITQHSQNPW